MMIEIDMKMPSCCDECFALDFSGDYPYCIISEECQGYNFNVYENRMPSCPLKDNEPRVLTLEEIRTHPKEKFLVWLERTYADGAETGLAPYEITGVGTKGVSHYFGSDDFASYNHKCYGWRCWSAKPTDEQRRVVPWNT